MDWLLGTQPQQVIAEELHPPYPSVSDNISRWVAAREAGMSDPCQLPAVERGVEIIASAVAMMSVNTYVNGEPMPVAPGIVNRPDPWRSRYTFLNMTVRSMVETGDVFWFLMNHDPESGRARNATVVDPSEVSVSWDAARMLPRYQWRGRMMTPGVDFMHIPLSPRVGHLEGTSPVKQAAAALWTVEATEVYAAGHFVGAGVPSGVLEVPTQLDKGEADALKAQWLESHAGPTRTPAILSGGVKYEVTASDPEHSQLVEAREQGVAVVARLLGIPTPLLLVSLPGGSSLTYQNIGQVYSEFIRSTLQPLYLVPIENAWSDLLPRTQTVRFDVNDIFRIELSARVDVYEKLVALGVVDATWIQRNEGIRPPSQTPTLYAPSPPAIGDQMDVPEEVPAP
jgi:HK97 family phage portal protein